MTELDEMFTAPAKTRWTPPKTGRREVLFGGPSTGKTTLALAVRAAIGGDIHYIDADDSLPKLWPEVEAAGIDPFIEPVPTPKTLSEFMIAYNKISSGTAIIDTYSRIENLMAKDVNSKYGVDSYDMMDYGKGTGAMYRKHCEFFDLMDAKAKIGVNTILICHSTIVEIKEQNGVAYHRIQPQIAVAKDGKPSSVEELFKRADGARLIAIDVSADKKKTAASSGTRMVYSDFHPSRMTKGRPALEDYTVKCAFDSDFWKAVFK